MKKNKKLELLTGIVDEFNLSVNDVVSYWLKSGRLNLDASTVSSQTESSGKYETPKRVLPGMFVYADGLIYPEIIEGRQIKAVVGYVEDKTVYAVCLREEKLPWSGDWLEVKATRKMTGGQEATCKILEAARQTGKKVEAAQWCYDYVYDGVKQGEAFLPSIGELEKLFANKVLINASLKALDVAMLDGWYWSSTEDGNGSAWKFSMSNGYRDWSNKGNTNYVRPVLALKL